MKYMSRPKRAAVKAFADIFGSEILAMAISTHLYYILKTSG